MTGPDSTELAHKRELLETYRKNLHRQEKIAAEHGLNVPLPLANEIDFLKQEIAKLTQELEAYRPQLYQEALAQQETTLTDRPAVLALGLGTDISGRVQEFLRQKGEPLATLADQVISHYVRAPEGEKLIPREDLPKVIADLHGLRKDLEARAVTELLFFYYGPISLAVAIGRVFSNWVPIKMYNFSQGKYELDMVVETVQLAAISPDISPTATRPHQRPQIITWLHLSDLHLRESHVYDENIVLKALVRDITERIQIDGLHPDFIVVTGDVAFSGKPAEYVLARPFFDELLTTVGLPRERLFVVPGNHDVDRNLITAGAKAIGAVLTNRDSVNILLTTPGDRRLVFERFKGYAEFVNDYFAGHLAFGDERYFYVQTFDLSGRCIALLGLNSAWLATSDEDKALGLVIGERQARKALEQAEGADLKVALLHHPFDWLREFDQNDSAAMLFDNCDFVLHGHLHRAAMNQLISPDSGAMIIASGACYKTRQYPNSYNFVRLDLSAETGVVYLRRYSDERGGFWAKDVLTYRNTPDGVYTFALHMPTPLQSRPHSSPTVGGVRGSLEGVYQPGDDVTTSNGRSIITPGINLDAVRHWLNRAFDEPDLDAFCLDYFPDVYDRFSRGMRKDEKITLLLDHCRRVPARYQKLLAALER